MGLLRVGQDWATKQSTGQHSSTQSRTPYVGFQSFLHAGLPSLVLFLTCYSYFILSKLDSISSNPGDHHALLMILLPSPWCRQCFHPENQCILPTPFFGFPCLRDRSSCVSSSETITVFFSIILILYGRRKKSGSSYCIMNIAEDLICVPINNIFDGISSMCVCFELSCVRLFVTPWCSPPGSSVHGDSPGRNTGVGSHALL